jgi:hypothetical protein
MWYHALLALWNLASRTQPKRRPPGPARRKPQSHRLVIEALEDRAVPSNLPVMAAHGVERFAVVSALKGAVTRALDAGAPVAHRHKGAHHHPNHFIAKFPNRSITPVVTEGSVATLRGTIVDGDPNGTFVLQVDWGDSTPTQVFLFPPRGQVELSHTYTVLGVHTVHLIWRDLLDGSFGPARSDDLTVQWDPCVGGCT